MSGVNRVYTEDELITRIWDKENIRHTMNRLCYYLSNEEPRRAVNELWVTKGENRARASLGLNTGYYDGFDEVVRHLVLDRNRRLYDNMEARHAGDASIESSGLNLGYGCSGFRTLTTPLVILSDDGLSAKFLGYSPGYGAEGRPDGTADAYLTFDLVFADLLKENGRWRILHLVFAHDHTVECGANYAKQPLLDWSGDPITLRDGKPTTDYQVHNPLYGWEYLYDDMPAAYYTYMENRSYGPKGDLGKPYYERGGR